LLVAKLFESDAEVKLVDVLRESRCEKLSLVALDRDLIIDYILFTPVKLDGDNQLIMIGLAPSSVSADHQGIGIGYELVKAGLNECKKLDCDAVVVPGAPKYYERSGFKPASEFGNHSVYEVENFMLLE